MEKNLPSFPFSRSPLSLLRRLPPPPQPNFPPTLTGRAGKEGRRIFSSRFWLRSADPPFLLTHLPRTSIHVVVPWLACVCSSYPCSIASFLPRPPPVLHLASAACLVVVLRSSVPPPPGLGFIAPMTESGAARWEEVESGFFHFART